MKTYYVLLFGLALAFVMSTADVASAYGPRYWGGPYGYGVTVYGGQRGYSPYYSRGYYNYGRYYRPSAFVPGPVRSVVVPRPYYYGPRYVRPYYRPYYYR